MGEKMSLEELKVFENALRDGDKYILKHEENIKEAYKLLERFEAGDVNLGLVCEFKNKPLSKNKMLKIQDAFMLAVDYIATRLDYLKMQSEFIEESNDEQNDSQA